MNNSRFSTQFCRIFSGLFILTFSLLLLSIIIFGYENESSPHTFNCSFLQHIIIILSFGLITVAFVAVNRLIQSDKIRLKKYNADLYFRIGVILVIFLMMCFQVYCANRLQSTPQDLPIIDRFAKSFGKSGSFSLVGEKLRSGKNTYIIKYPNNYAIMFFLAAIYRLAFLLGGSIPDFLPVAVNIIAIDLSVFLTVMLSRKLLGKRAAVITLLLCVLFAPYYTLVTYYYTDTLSMPFLIGGVTLLLYVIDCEKRTKKYALAVLCGLLMFEGFKMKGSLIILFIVGIVYLFLKLRAKKALCLALALCVGFGSGCLLFKSTVKAANLCTEQEEYETQYPYTHWVMMGLRGNGGFSKTDSLFTKSFPNLDAKTEANLSEIGARLEKMGKTGLLKHLVKKAVWTWEDGTYYSSRILENYDRRCLLHSFVLNDGRFHFPFYAFTCGLQLFLIFGMIISAIKNFRNPELNAFSLMRGLVFAIFVFLLIWETRSRYILNFTPMFMLLATEGIKDGVRSKQVLT